MAAPNTALDDVSMSQPSWTAQDEPTSGPTVAGPSSVGSPFPLADNFHNGQDGHNPADYHRGSSAGENPSGSIVDDSSRDKQVKPNKVYIGGLPDHTQEKDLQDCFGKIGNIIDIELKNGFGFVEFDSREAAEESVSKYHEGRFMGNKIRVELSKGGSRSKVVGDPGACFKCGQLGHWARECPNQAMPSRHGRPTYEPPPSDRLPPGAYSPPSKQYYRDDYPPPPMHRYPPRDVRDEYYPPPRDYRRPPSPPYREPPALGRGRDYDDYHRGPPPDRYGHPPPPPPDYRPRYPPADPGYRPYPPPPPHGPYYDRYDRHPPERYPPQSYPPPHPTARLRSPPRSRDEYDRPPPHRDYPDYRRPLSPPRYPEYSRPGSADPPPGRYRRRSESPPSRAPAVYDNHHGNHGYNNYPPRGAPPARDYAPPRNGRNSPPSNGYRRPL